MNGQYVVGLGSNLGSRESFLRAAVDLLEVAPGLTVLSLSSVFETDPIGPPQPRYLNAAVRVEVPGDANALFELGQSIETRLGRQRGERWAARTVDLDVLWAQSAPIQTRHLIVPHPRLEERAFALAPLLQVAPELEDVYGPRLRALGGAPDCRGFLGIEPSPNLSVNGGRCVLEVIDRDRDQALAAAATGFAAVATGDASARPLEVRPVRRECRAGSECAAFVFAVRSELEAGFRVTRAVVSVLEKGRVCGFLLGQPALAEPPVSCQLEVKESLEQGRITICWQLG